MSSRPDKLLPFAVIPAAGRSRRMGTPKLLLEFGGQSIIARLLDSLADAGVHDRIVVIRAEDTALREEIERHGGRAFAPAVAPPEMRDSVAIGIRAALEPLGDNLEPHLARPWILVPADHPIVLPATVRTLLDAAATRPERIIVPTCRGRRGHPTVFAIKHGLAIDALPANEGVNALLRRYASDVSQIEVGCESVLFDLDTPTDLERLQKMWSTRSARENY